MYKNPQMDGCIASYKLYVLCSSYFRPPLYISEIVVASLVLCSMYYTVVEIHVYFRHSTVKDS